LKIVEFTVPIRIESEMNSRCHWSVRRKRFTEHKQCVSYAWPKPRYRDYGDGALVVTLTRIGPRKLDSDNLASGFKAVRDEIARIIGIDDGDSRITWRYDQRKGKPREYAAIIRIEPIHKRAHSLTVREMEKNEC
jgi:hypothetical protein